MKPSSTPERTGVCICGHRESMHLHGKSCGSPIGLGWCKCEQFRAVGRQRHEDGAGNQGQATLPQKRKAVNPTFWNILVLQAYQDLLLWWRGGKFGHLEVRRKK